MANLFSDILQGAGKVGGDIVQGVGDYARRYKYGPYYKENQQLQTKIANARLEAERARKAYWERGDTNSAMGINNLSKALTVAEERLLMSEPDSDDERRWSDAVDKLYSALMTSISPTKEEPKSRWDMMTNPANVPEQVRQQIEGKGPKVQVSPSQTAGALSGITPTVTPTKKKGIAQKTKQWLKENQLPTGPVGTFAQGMFAAKGLAQKTPKPVAKVTEIAPTDLEEIWEQLTDEEKQTAKLAMQKGKTAEQIVTYFKAQL